MGFIIPKFGDEDLLRSRQTEEIAIRGRSKNEKTAFVIHSLRGECRLKDLLSYAEFPKATYMYWQKRLG